MALAQIKDYRKLNHLLQIEHFLQTLEGCDSDKQIISLLTKTLYTLLSPNFISFVENKKDGIKVVSQIGEKKYILRIKRLFNRAMSEQIFNWVLERDSSTSINFAGNESFYFIPITHKLNNESYKHGIVVLMLQNNLLDINKNLETSVKIIVKLCSQALYCLKNAKNQSTLQPKLNIDTEDISTLNKIITSLKPIYKATDLKLEVIEDQNASKEGSIWWLGQLNANTKLVFTGVVNVRGISKSLINGYIISYLNNIQSMLAKDITPSTVLSNLNLELNAAFKNVGITVDAFFSMIDTDERYMTFSCANHPVPFLIGPEQQILELSERDDYSQSLGISLSTQFIDSAIFLPFGSRIIVFTKSLIDNAASVGHSYDSSWLRELLETLSSLSLIDMKESLDNLLIKNNSGTALKAPRLGLLLEIPSV